MPARRKSLEGPGPGPTGFVLFGATGDLAKRMVLPAFYQLAIEDLLPEDGLPVGNDRGDVAHERRRFCTWRGSATTFSAIWNSEHIESVQIDVPERLGVTDRALFYGSTGAVLDMLVTHLFQVMAEVAMEPPASLGADDLQAAREKALASFRPLDPAEVVLANSRGTAMCPASAPAREPTPSSPPACG